MNTFDQLSRYVTKDDPSGFIRWAVTAADAARVKAVFLGETASPSPT